MAKFKKSVVSLLVVILTLCFDQPTTADVMPCGDWEPYKLELCYKIFHNSGNKPLLTSFEEAEKLCIQNYGQLVTIHYGEEQEFLTNYLFKWNKVVDSVWIGALYDDKQTKKYKWKDGTDLIFTNWAKEQPKNLANYCVEMHSDVDSIGKWVSEPCIKNNAVVCQKRQPVSKELLEDTVNAMQHTLLQLQGELGAVKSTLANLEHELSSNAVPVGFTYVQLPKEKSPEQIWPKIKWTDVSKDYANVFFRVLGDQTATFGTVQEANSTGIAAVEVENYGFDLQMNQSAVLNTPGQWTKRIYTGTYNHAEPPETQFSWRLFISGGEIRPKNMAIKVWKRVQ